jgi:hypothetical protein
MGPDCRKKYLKAETSPENREAANKLVAQIALAMSGNYAEGAKLAASKIADIRALGFEKLADKLVKETITVRIEREGDKLVVKSAFSERFVEESRKISGRRWEKDLKATTFPASAGPALWTALRVSYPGANALGPKGFFVI